MASLALALPAPFVRSGASLKYRLQTMILAQSLLGTTHLRLTGSSPCPTQKRMPTLTEYDERLFIEPPGITLPKRLSRLDYTRAVNLDAISLGSGISIRYAGPSGLYADIIVYSREEEVLGDGVNLVLGG